MHNFIISRVSQFENLKIEYQLQKIKNKKLLDTQTTQKETEFHILRYDNEHNVFQGCPQFSILY